MPPTVLFPWDGRDHEDQAEARYNSPVRAKNKKLEEENMLLKRLLREHGIPWSPSVLRRAEFLGPHASLNDPGQSAHSPQSTRSTRSSVAAAREGTGRRVPHLPTEVLVRILQYALTSSDPIVDPLSSARPENMTLPEKGRGSKIAIGALAACRAFYAEGRRILWNNNSFIFTTVEALRNFGDLDLSFRQGIKHVNLRIIARYYDDEDRKHRLFRGYHPTVKKDITLRVIPRVKDSSLSRKGFRCYAWAQLVDFLDALRAPFDPKHDRSTPRPRLFPGLETMRLDFVNFPESFLPFSGSDLHEIAAHDFGCTLDEVAVTGLPCCEVGMKVCGDLGGMVRDGGLFLDGAASFVQLKNGKSLKPLPEFKYYAKIVRAWRKQFRETRTANDEEAETDEEVSASAASDALLIVEDGGEHQYPSVFDLPAAPEEEGHPVSRRKRKTMWKRVPISRDSHEREWVEFDANTGFRLEDMLDMLSDSDEDADMADEDEDPVVCPQCGEIHPPWVETDEF